LDQASSTISIETDIEDFSAIQTVSHAEVPISSKKVSSQEAERFQRHRRNGEILLDSAVHVVATFRTIQSMESF
jgi:hypothetical protein